MTNNDLGVVASRKVHLSGRFLRVTNPTGTQRAARQWLLATIPHFPRKIVVHAPVQEAQRREIQGVEFSTIPGRRGSVDHLWEQFCFPATTGKGGLWTLAGTGPVWHPGQKHVMCVYDLHFLMLPKVFTFPFRCWYRFACANAARRADRVVCTTDYVRDSLESRLGIPRSRISVVHIGPGLGAISRATEAGVVQERAPYFLCVGSLQPHKNLVTVLGAWKEFVQTHPKFRLKIVGRKQARFAALSPEVSGSSMLGVEFTGYVNDRELCSLYRGATGFLFPSLEEGFGLPVVEAFYCGCAVVTSSVSCLPEVAGGAAILVDPLSRKGLYDAMVFLADDAVGRRVWQEAGLRRSNAFCWETAGAKMAAILSAEMR